MCRKSVHRHNYSTHCARHTHATHVLRCLRMRLWEHNSMRYTINQINTFYEWSRRAAAAAAKNLILFHECHCARSCEWNEIEQVFLIRRHSHFYITPRSATTTKEQLYIRREYTLCDAALILFGRYDALAHIRFIINIIIWSPWINTNGIPMRNVTILCLSTVHIYSLKISIYFVIN